MLLSDILKEKTVAVWGLGYLGYTTILKLQNSGFNILAYDFEERQLNSLLHGKYPTGSQKVSWSGTGFVPSLDFNKIKVAKSAGEMIKGSPLHIIAIPEDERTASGANIAVKLAGIFGHNFKNFSAKPCFIFESAFIPGHIEKYFIGNLKKYGLNVTKDYCAGALFRTDWSIEAFMGKKNRMPIAGCCAKSLDILRAFCEYMGVMPLEMGGIKEAEVYINSTNVIQAMINDFVRQLAMGYPFINMKKLSNILFENITLDDCVLNMGTGGTRMTLAIDYLLQGSDSPKQLTLLNEFQDINISSVLSYADYIVRKSYKTVTILGITYKGNQKDLTLSPSVTLANYLLSNSIKVNIHDPFCSSQEILKLVKNVKVAKYPEEAFASQVIVIASDHNQYKYLTQAQLDLIKKNKISKLVIDNYGVWSHLSFGRKTVYHQVGDGTLNFSK